jgi:hypothetical protein
MSGNAPRRTNQSDPSAEPGPGLELSEDVFNRNEEVRYQTPRRYEEDDEESSASDRH